MEDTSSSDDDEDDHMIVEAVCLLLAPFLRANDAKEPWHVSFLTGEAIQASLNSFGSKTKLSWSHKFGCTWSGFFTL
jgi:hypothetical protein